MPILEIFYLISSFFFKFIWYLFIYLLTLRCKDIKKYNSYIQNDIRFNISLSLYI
nr:MAG TPA: hypothetical protein [Caudoviricetes sp.]